jgi:hypothetical protein
MNGIEILIDKTLAGSRLACGETRREVAAELRSHLEDSMNEARRAGYDDEEAERFAVAHFGSPELVSRDFARVYRFERVRFYIVAFGSLIFASIVAVAGFTYLVQRMLVTNFGLQHRLWCFSPKHLASELLLVAGIIIGYFGLFFTRRLFSRGPMLKALVVVGIMFLLAAGLLQFCIEDCEPILAEAYICAVFISVIEMRFGHWIAKFVLVALALTAFGTLLGVLNHLTSTPEIMVTGLIWTTIAVSSYGVALCTSLFDRHVLSRRFAGSSV